MRKQHEATEIAPEEVVTELTEQSGEVLEDIKDTLEEVLDNINAALEDEPVAEEKPTEEPAAEEETPEEEEETVFATVSHEIPTWDDVTEKFANWVSRGRTEGGATERSMIDAAINELVYFPEAQTTMKAWAAKQESPSGCTGWVAILREFVSLMRLYPYESIDA